MFSSASSSGQEVLSAPVRFRNVHTNERRVWSCMIPRSAALMLFVAFLVVVLTGVLVYIAA